MEFPKTRSTKRKYTEREEAKTITKEKKEHSRARVARDSRLFT